MIVGFIRRLLNSALPIQLSEPTPTESLRQRCSPIMFGLDTGDYLLAAAGQLHKLIDTMGPHRGDSDTTGLSLLLGQGRASR